MKNILVPVDFSKESINALKEAIKLAEKVQSNIHIVHVFESHLFNIVFEKTIKLNKERNEEVHKVLKERLMELKGTVEKNSNIQVYTHIKTGKVYKEVAMLSDELRAEFIVAGTHGASGFEKIMLGTNATRLASIATSPLITLRKNASLHGYKKIVLPLDFTKETKQKVSKAIELAKTFDSEILIVSILTKKDSYVKNQLTRQMNQVQVYFKKESISHTAELVEGDQVAKGVIQYAHDKSADFILIMSQEETEISEYLLGTDAEQIIKLSEIPVMSLRPKKTSKIVFHPY